MAGTEAPVSVIGVNSMSPGETEVLGAVATGAVITGAVVAAGLGALVVGAGAAGTVAMLIGWRRVS